MRFGISERFWTRTPADIMWHLSSKALVDLAEGTRPEQAFPHLATCARCQRELAALRLVLSTAAAADVPEPSPLFWDHLSERIHEAVRSEMPAPGRSWTTPWASWRSIALGSVVGFVFVVALGWGIVARRGVDRGTLSVVARASDRQVDTQSENEAPFTFVVDLAESLDWETAAEAGLTTRRGMIDDTLTELSSDERLELQRLLNEALSKPGA